MSTQVGLTAESPRFDHIYYFLANRSFHSSLSSTQRGSVLRSAKKFRVKGGKLYYAAKGGLRLVLHSRSAIETALRECHNDPGNGGHKGVTVTLKKVEMTYYWATMTKDVKDWVKACPECQRMSKTMKSEVPELKPTRIPLVDGTWDVVSINLMGPYVETERGCNYIFTASDLFSKFVFARPIKSNAAGDVSAAIIDLFYVYGSPRHALSNQGPEFINELNEHIFKAFGVRHSVTSAHHPTCNAQDERTNRSIVAAISKYVNTENTDWDMHVAHAAYSCNISYQHSIKMTPYKAFFKRDPHMAGSLNNQGESTADVIITHVSEVIDMARLMEAAKQLDDKIQENITSAQLKRKRAYDKRKVKGLNAVHLTKSDRVPPQTW